MPGAIKAGQDFDTGTTWFCDNEPNDIPEDFNCTPNVRVTIPANATHLFVAVRDSYYEDNTDDDDDFGVKISKYNP